VTLCWARVARILLQRTTSGHGLEGDFTAKGTQRLRGRVGKRVAAKGITVIDADARAPARLRSNVDREGNPDAAAPC